MEISPPLGFTTTLPPYVFYPLSINSPAFPTSHNPSASYVTNSLAEKQSCNSTTYISLGLSPDWVKAILAALSDISSFINLKNGEGGGGPNLHPARFIKLCSVNDFELSVVKATPRISIA